MFKLSSCPCPVLHRLRRQAILDQVQNWITAASEWNSAHAATLTSLKNQLASLLAKL